MALSIDFADDAKLQAKIKVVGVGGGGGNAINTMIHSGLEGVEFIAANTDTQALSENLAAEKIALGASLTRGLGAGALPEVGRKAALEEVQRIAESVAGADMVFVTAGMGGGTGTGAAPIIAQIARDQGALTVAVVTKPFLFEGRRRMKNASEGLDELAESVDTIISIPNEKLLDLGDEDMSMQDAFRRADDVLVQAVRGISDLIVHTGMINVDFADVKTIMSCTGRALMGTGYGRGENRAIEAAQVAINSPLLDDISVEGATGILINFTAGPDIGIREISRAASLVQEAAHEEANIIFGLVTDPEMSDVVKVTVIATGFDMQPASQDGPLTRGRASAPSATHVPNSVPVGVRQASQQVLSRTGVGVPSQPQAQHVQHVQRDVLAQPKRRPPQVPVQAQIPVGNANPAPRPFGASAIHDEATLDIPAYIRRSRP
ncbi:MAG: cell division protein FtsZ [Myxococcales bacterium]|nr:cell division protein FtsZ [Myxococcales bacterium]